jgi:hypothetical protein
VRSRAIKKHFSRLLMIISSYPSKRASAQPALEDVCPKTWEYQALVQMILPQLSTQALKVSKRSRRELLRIVLTFLVTRLVECQ